MKHKYFARRTPCQHGHSHPSTKEARRCNDLHLLLRSGHIAELQVEPFFPFVIGGKEAKHLNGRRIGYKPDFQYREAGKLIVEDVKSPATMTEAATLRMALFRHLYPEIELRTV